VQPFKTQPLTNVAVKKFQVNCVIWIIGEPVAIYSVGSSFLMLYDFDSAEKIISEGQGFAQHCKINDS
jgi:hypothetical protein